MTIQSIAPCNGWYFAAKGIHKEDIIFKVAAWALMDTGDVIGLISVSDATTDGNVARLVGPPPIKGTYLTEEKLSEQQKTSINKPTQPMHEALSAPR